MEMTIDGTNRIGRVVTVGKIGSRTVEVKIGILTRMVGNRTTTGPTSKINQTMVGVRIAIMET